MGTISTEYLNPQPSLFSMAADDLKSIGLPEKQLASMNFEDLLKGVAAGSSSERDEEEQNSSSGVKRSAEEVWKEIRRGKPDDGEEQEEGGEGGVGLLPQQTTGEMTLEDFLVRSGVVKGESGDNSSEYEPFKRLKVSQEVCGGGKLEDGLVPVSVARMYPDVTVCYHGKSEEYVDKAAERRQRRMIKNRESAARSRARKQAYTAELEAEVTRLKEENETLRRQQTEHERWRNKVLDIMTVVKKTERTQVAAQPLRRTNSV